VALLVTGSVQVVAAANPRPALPTGGRAWDEPEADTGRLVVALRAGATSRDVERLDDGSVALVRFERRDRRVVFHAPRSGLAVARARLQRDPAVESVSVSRRLYRDVDPSGEQYWSYLWGLHNTGQTVFDSRGVADLDIDARQALDVSTGDGVVVAVIDDGVDFTHPDLAGQAWTNPGEWGDDGIANGRNKQDNGLDDDGNDFVDDVNGWDFCNDDNTVHDPGEDFHGTHVAGTIAASLNGTGIVGVSPGVKIMALKFLGDGVDEFGEPNCGWDDQAAAAIAYATSFDVRISNNSWGREASPFTGDDALIHDAVASSNMLFVTSAGNAGRNNDTSSRRSIPASFDLANILTVAAIDNQGNLADFSNYGPTTVDVAAPGVGILSAIPAYDFDAECCGMGWLGLDGTSMAAPHVTGIAALVGSMSPSMTTSALKARILGSAKARGRTVGLTATGRIADAAYALDATAPTGQAPGSYAFVSGTAIGSTISTRVRWPAGSDDLSGIGSYAVRQSLNGGGWSTITAATTALSLDRSLAVNSSYRFRVRAQDRAGNSGAYLDGPLIKPTVTQQTSSSVTYGGTWSTSSSSTASGGSTRYSTRAGAWVSYTFSGRAVAVVAPKSSSRGSVRVYVDGAYLGTVSTYRSSGQSRMLVFGKNWGSVATHTIKLVVVGTSGHARFDIDAFAVLR
jgi:subtilisin family serine protease